MWANNFPFLALAYLNHISSFAVKTVFSSTVNKLMNYLLPTLQLRKLKETSMVSLLVF